MAIMKNTGMLWIGQIPVDWELGKVKYAFNRKKEKSTEKDLTVLSLARTGVKVRDISTNEGQLAASYEGYNSVEPNDLLLNPMDLVSGANCSISKVSGVISPAYVNLRAKIGFEPRYYDYYFKTQYWNMGFFAHGKGVSFENRWTLNDATLKDYYIPMPPLSEQQAIADYLDKTCSQIDEIIAEAKASIDEYKELKIGQINKYTVYKMKRTKLKYITEKIGDGIHTTPEYSDEGTIRFINGGSFGEDSIKMIGPMLSNEEYQKQNKSLLNEHTVMIALNGANFGNTSLYNNETILLGKSAGYITLKPTVCREYVRYCLENSVTKEAFDLSLNGTTIPNLSLNTLRNTEICLPDYSIQKQLAKTIKKMIVKIDSLIAEKESLINDLEAYKKSLIYEVVTGKRRVV